MPDNGRERSPRNRLPANVLSNVAMLGLNMAVGLWLTPYLVRHLGVAVFGLVSLATSVTSYMSIINSALNSAVGRFLTIELQQGLFGAANRTFNTALGGSAAAALVLLPAVLVLSAAAPRLFNMPAGHEQEARWLFAAVMVAYLIGVVRSVFAVSAFASNRLDLQNLIVASGLFARLLAVVLLFALLTPRVWLVGLSTLLGTLFSLAIAMAVWQRLTPELTVDRRAFDRTRLAALFQMSGWMTINQVGTLLFLNIDLIVVNLALGAEAAGRYGSVLQWPLLLRTFAAAISGALTPLILMEYARGAEERITCLSRQAVKLLGLGMALPVGVVCGLARPLLRLWLGSDFASLAPLLVVMIAHLCINLAVLPLFSIQVALNRVKWPGIVTLLMGFANLGLAVWWSGWEANGLGVALAGGLVLLLKNALFTPLYSAHIQRLRYTAFLSSMAPGVVGATAVGLVCYALGRVCAIGSWPAFIGLACLVAAVYAAVAYTVGLDDGERRLLAALAPWRASRIRVH